MGRENPEPCYSLCSPTMWEPATSCSITWGSNPWPPITATAQHGSTGRIPLRGSIAHPQHHHIWKRLHEGGLLMFYCQTLLVGIHYTHNRVMMVMMAMMVLVYASLTNWAQIGLELRPSDHTNMSAMEQRHCTCMKLWEGGVLRLYHQTLLVGIHYLCWYLLSVKKTAI